MRELRKAITKGQHINVNDTGWASLGRLVSVWSNGYVHDGLSFDEKKMNVLKGMEKLGKLETLPRNDSVSCQKIPLQEVVSPDFAATVLVDDIKTALTFMCKNDARYYTNGAWLTESKLVATDTLTLIEVSHTPAECSEDKGGIIIPTEFWEMVVKLSAGSLLVRIDVNVENLEVSCRFSEVVIHSRCIGGQMPPYESAFPQRQTTYYTVAITPEVEAMALQNKGMATGALVESPDIRYNIKNLKKCAIVREGETDDLNRPLLFRKGNIRTLCVPSRM